jgi:hypothetical protein
LNTLEKNLAVDHQNGSIGRPFWSRRMFFYLIGVVIFAIAAASLSIVMRRTQSEQTRVLLGEEAIFALQYGKSFHIRLPSGSSLIDPKRSVQWLQQDGSQRTNLTDTPGLGHFRHALLDDRHYNWETRIEATKEHLGVDQPELVFVEIAGPPTEVKPTVILIELSAGWVGLAQGTTFVQVTDRVRPALRNFIKTRKDINNSYVR